MGKISSDGLNTDLFFSLGKTNSCGVLVGFYGNINYSVKKKLNDNSGKILVLNVAIDGKEYLLINLYNENTEQEQLKSLENLSKVLLDFFDQKLQSAGGNPILRNLVVSKLMEPKESLKLCDIW